MDDFYVSQQNKKNFPKNFKEPAYLIFYYRMHLEYTETWEEVQKLHCLIKIQLGKKNQFVYNKLGFI